MTDLIDKNKYLKDTIQLKVTTEAAFLELAKRLYTIHTDKVWEGQYASYEEFLLDAQLSKATASKLEKVYETFQLKFSIPREQLARVGWSSLYAAAAYVDSKEKALEVVDKAALLTRADLEKTLRKESGKIQDHEHEWITYRQCTICSERHRIYEDEHTS